VSVPALPLHCSEPHEHSRDTVADSHQTLREPPCSLRLCVIFSLCLYLSTSLRRYFLSVMPLLRILSPCILLHMLGHPLHQIRRRCRLPSMPLHRPTILKIALTRRIRQ